MNETFIIKPERLLDDPPHTPECIGEYIYGEYIYQGVGVEMRIDARVGLE